MEQHDRQHSQNNWLHADVVPIRASTWREVIGASYTRDDLLVEASKREEGDAVRTRLLEQFRLKELGVARFVLGIEVKQNTGLRTIAMKQSRYISGVVECFGQVSARQTLNPCPSGERPSASDSPSTDRDRADMRKLPYRSLIGCLLYVSMCTRPNVSFAVGHLCRYVENSGRTHSKAAVHVLRYLWPIREHGLQFKGDSGSINLQTFCHSDWAASGDDRRSVSGVVVFAADRLVIFKSRTQSSVELRTSEAELVAESLAAQDIKWARRLLLDMKIVQNEPTTLLCDNQGAIAMANNSVTSQRAKHIDIRARFVWKPCRARSSNLSTSRRQIISRTCSRSRCQQLEWSPFVIVSVSAEAASCRCRSAI